MWFQRFLSCFSFELVKSLFQVKAAMMKLKMTLEAGGNHTLDYDLSYHN